MCLVLRNLVQVREIDLSDSDEHDIYQLTVNRWIIGVDLLPGGLDISQER